MARFERDGFQALNRREQVEAMAYFEDGKAHYRKPLGAMELF